jgi:hypothetical protein
MRVRPSSDIPCRPYALDAGPKLLVHHHAAVNLKARLPGQLEIRLDAHTDYHEVGLKPVTIIQQLSTKLPVSYPLSAPTVIRLLPGICFSILIAARAAWLQAAPGVPVGAARRAMPEGR